KAQLHLTAALAEIPPNDSALHELRSQAQNLLEEARRGLFQQRLHQETQSRFEQFRKGRDDTLFLATSPTGKDLAASLRGCSSTCCSSWTRRRWAIGGGPTWNSTPPSRRWPTS